MANEYGLDYKYFEGKLQLIIRDASRYTPGEMARSLARLSATADKNVNLEPEFQLPLKNGEYIEPVCDIPNCVVCPQSNPAQEKGP